MPLSKEEQARLDELTSIGEPASSPSAGGLSPEEEARLAELSAIPAATTSAPTSGLSPKEEARLAELSAIPTAEPPKTAPAVDPNKDPFFRTAYVKKAELENIANKHGVSSGLIKFAADMHAANRETTGEDNPISEYWKSGLTSQTLGTLNTMTGNIVFKGITQLAYGDKERRALDEVKKLSDDRRSYLDALLYGMGAGKAATPLATGTPAVMTAEETAAAAAAALLKPKGFLPKAKELAVAGAKAAPLGAAFGYGSSETGKELEGTALGAAAGAVAPTAIAGVVKVATPFVKGAYRAGEFTVSMFRASEDKGAAATLMQRAQEHIARQEPVELGLKELFMDSIENKNWEKNINPKLADAISTPEQQLSAQLAGEGVGAEVMSISAAKRSIVKTYIEEQRASIAGELSRGEKPTSVEGVQAIFNIHKEGITGKSRLEEMWDGNRIEQAQIAIIKKDPIAASVGVSEKNLIDTLVPVHKAAELIDIRNSTNTKGAVDKMILASNQMTKDRLLMIEKAKPIVAMIRAEENFAGTEGNKYLSILVEKGKAWRDKMVGQGVITKNEAHVAEAVANLGSELGDDLEKKGLSFTRIVAEDGSPAYIHHTLLPAEESRALILAKYDQLQADMTSGADRVRAIKFNPNIKNSPEQQLIRSAEILSGKEILDTDSFRAAINIVRENKAHIVQNIGLAKATLMREGEIPDLIRNWNVTDSLTDYINNGTKVLAYRGPLRELRSQIKILKELGDTHSGDYLDAVIAHVVGGTRPMELGDKALRAFGASKNQIAEKMAKLEVKQEAEMARILGKPLEEATSVERVLARRETAPIREEIESLRVKKDLLGNAAFISRSFMFSNLLTGIKAPLIDLAQPFATGINAIGGVWDCQSV